jgi:hypothetical protein
MERWGVDLNGAERHSDIIHAVDVWVNAVLLAPASYREHFLAPNSRFLKTLFSLIRTPPANYSEDVLHYYIVH